MNIVHIKPADGKCQLCETVAELRPYGPGGKFVCFSCAKKDETEMKRQFDALTRRANVTIIGTPAC